jgi:hypothetical protein
MKIIRNFFKAYVEVTPQELKELLFMELEYGKKNFPFYRKIMELINDIDIKKYWYNL